jgi:tetratricopeptide (TPR) repeat protein
MRGRRGAPGWCARIVPLCGTVLLGGLAPTTASGAIPRSVPAVAEIVAVKGDERVQFVEEPTWRVAEVRQDLAQGDALQTGPYGGLALLFRDATQIRVHRNSTLLVKGVRTPPRIPETLLRLERGAAWMRARSAPGHLRMETPAATAAIRGTDWHLQVEPGGRSILTVLEGVVEFANPFGSIIVTRGEIGIAEVGRPPVKAILLTPKDRPQWELVLTPDWLRSIPVTGLPAGRLAAERGRLESLVAGVPAVETLLDLAEVTYEMGDFAHAERWLLEARGAAGAPGPPQAARVRLLEGLLAAKDYRYAAALGAFREAAAALADRRRLVARIGEYGVLAASHRAAEAEAVVSALRAEFPHEPEPVLARIHLLSFQGERSRARAETERAAAAFPQDARFPLWLGHLALVADEPEVLAGAIASALARDPDYHLAWQLKGNYYHLVRPEARAAEAAYRRAIAIMPMYAPAWNDLAVLLTQHGHYTAARRAVERALALAPRDAIYKASLGLLLTVVEERLDDSERLFRAALDEEPGHASALLGMGALELRRGNVGQAVEWMLRATVANPGLSGAMTSLAVAQYQAGDVEGSRRSLETALRLDPLDAVPAIVGSALAQDQAEAGLAIRLAHEAVRRFEQAPTLLLEGLAQNQRGILNLGSAYTALGLTDWGSYHGERSESPYSAASQLFLSTVYPTDAARQGAAVQGLLLDPLAVSTRARYVDLVRRPFLDVSLGGGVGAEGGVHTDTEFVTAQGLWRSQPVAFFASLVRTHSEGHRENSARTEERGVLGVGARLGLDHGLLLLVDAAHSRQGVPGVEDRPDRDDTTETLSAGAALGYHHRFGPANRVLLRGSARYLRQEFSNPRPLGSGLSPLSFSLLSAFGQGPTQTLYATGLCDITAGVVPPGPTFADPALGICGPSPVLASDVPADVDLKTLRSVRATGALLQLQARHLFDLGPVHLTYGAEWAPALIEVVTRRNELAPWAGGIGRLELVPGVTIFPFGSARRRTIVSDLDRHAVHGYAGAVWPLTRDLTLEGGLALRHLDDRAARRDGTRLDRRGGVAWHPARGQWIRLVGERASILPIEATLAPVATLGLVLPSDFTMAGSGVTSYRARWDAQWGEHVFTFLEAEHRRIGNFAVAVPQALEIITVEKGRLDSIAAGINAWLGDGWGLFAQHRWSLTDNLAKDDHRHRDLPLVPARGADLGLTWVHPWQIRAAVVASYVGRRPADPGNTSHLPSYWTLGARVNWQPWRKRWSFTLAGQDLLDEGAEVARGYPSPGRTVSLSAEYRFGGP